MEKTELVTIALNHKDISTTARYCDFDSSSIVISSTKTKIESALNKSTSKITSLFTDK